MRKVTRLALVVMAAVTVVLGGTVAAHGQDNTAVAVNKKDGKSVFKLAFSVKKTTGDVDATNTAVAYASCTGCRTVAAAIQVVLVSGDADSATPENYALAINYQCTECETLAAAYQFVFADGQEMQFTKEGKRRMHDLKKRFHDLKRRDDLTLEQLAAEIAVIAGEVAEVLETEMEPKKPADAAEGPTDTTTTTVGDPLATEAVTSSTTAAPVDTTTESPAETTTTTTATTEPTTTVAP